MEWIALDLGTSFIKGAILNIDALTITHIQRQPFPARVSSLPSLLHEVAPGEIVAATQTLIAQLLQVAPTCAGLVMCSQMHGLVLCAADGTPLSNAITWQDQRALQTHPGGEGTYYDRLVDRLTVEQQRQLGNELKPSLPLCALFWLAKQELLPSGPASPASLPDYVLATLAGTQPQIELTMAASHGAVNLETLDWHHEILAQLGLDRLQWPTIQPFGTAIYEIEVEGRRLPAHAAVGDHQCALVGAFLDVDELSLNIATGSQVSMVTSSLAFGEYQVRPYFDGRYLNTVTRIPAGRALNHLVALLTALPRAQQLEINDPWSTIAEAVAATADSDLAVDLSFFASASGTQGAIRNMREENLTLGHLFRAAFVNMAETYHTSALRLTNQPEEHKLVFSGGLAQKMAPLREIIATRFQSDYRTCASEEDALLGLLALALVAGGQASSVTEATKILAQRYQA